MDFINMEETIHSQEGKLIPALMFKIAPDLPAPSQGKSEARNRGQKLFEELHQILTPLEGVLGVFPDENEFSTSVVVERRLRRKLRKALRSQSDDLRSAFRKL
jgi:hypothetical protein